MKRLEKKYSKRGKTKNQQGFTLLEIAVALVIMMIATLGAAGLFVYAINYNSGAYDRTLAYAIAQRQLESLRRTPFDNLGYPAQYQSTVTSSGRSYTVVTTICSDPTANCGGNATLKRITVEVTPSSGADWVRVPVHVETLRAAIAPGSYF